MWVLHKVASHYIVFVTNSFSSHTFGSQQQANIFDTTGSKNYYLAFDTKAIAFKRCNTHRIDGARVFVQAQLRAIGM